MLAASSAQACYNANTTSLLPVLLLLLPLFCPFDYLYKQHANSRCSATSSNVSSTEQLLFGVCSALTASVAATAAAAATVATTASECDLTSRLAQFNLVYL
jgi:hypothetical protein